MSNNKNPNLPECLKASTTKRIAKKRPTKGVVVKVVEGRRHTEGQMNNLKRGKPWQKGQSGNPYWRARKGIAHIIEVFKEEGITVPRYHELEHAYMGMAQMTQAELKNILNDTEVSMMLRILAREILSRKWYETVCDILDRFLEMNPALKAQLDKGQTVNVNFVGLEKSSFLDPTKAPTHSVDVSHAYHESEPRGAWSTSQEPNYVPQGDILVRIPVWVPKVENIEPLGYLADPNEGVRNIPKIG